MTNEGSPDLRIKTSIKRFDNLTVARFVAALMVYFHHKLPIEQPDTSAGLLGNILANGYNGITFFFVLSGFVLASANLKKLEFFSIRGTLSFYWKRIARIVPLWLIVSAPFIWRAYKLNDPSILRYITFTQAWSPDLNVAYGVCAVAWTLSAEMFFYAMFPFVAAVLRPLKGQWIGPLLMVAGTSFSIVGVLYFITRPDLIALSWYDPDSPHRWLYLFPGVRLGDFLAGIGVFITIDRGLIRWTRPTATLILCGAVAALLVTMATLPIIRMAPTFPMVKTVWWTFPDIVFFAIIVLSLAQLELIGVSVKSKGLILLGEASFAFYLIHYGYMKQLLLPVLAKTAGVHIAEVTTLLLAMSISIGLYLAIEKPCRKLLLRLGHAKATRLARNNSVDVERMPY
jgi:peptidoglycan/LPS O-acetylase OafA/YrhL